MRTYRLVVEYDGAEFSGWQVQPDRRTVQGALREALATLTGGEEILPIGAGRTDAGVHARGQVASFRTSHPLDVARLARALTALTPEGLVVREAARAPDAFHARRSARARTYRYRLLDAPSAIWRRLAHFPDHPLDATRLAAGTAHLLGDQDMTSFAASADTSPSKRCVISEARWQEWEAGRELLITGDRFLHHMVRNVVGTLLRVGGGRWEPDEVAAIIRARDRRRAGPTAPAQGLTFLRVDYAPEDLREP